LLSGSTPQIKDCYFRPPRSAGQHPLKRQGLLCFFLCYTPPSAPRLASVTLLHPRHPHLPLAAWQPTVWIRPQKREPCLMFAAPLRYRLAAFFPPMRCSTAVQAKPLQPAILNIKTKANASQLQFRSRLRRLLLCHRRAIPQRSSPSVSIAFLTSIRSSTLQDSGKYQRLSGTSKAQLQPLRATTSNTSVDSSSTELEVKDCWRDTEARSHYNTARP
jgi:hypothetical protein